MPEEREKKPAEEDQLPPAEVAQRARSVMKAMLEMAPMPHQKVQRRAKNARAKAAKRKSKR